MATEVTDVQELSALSRQLVSNANELESTLNSLKKIVNRARNYDGIDVTTAGNVLKNNLTVLATDIKTTAQNINNYANGIEVFDKDDFSSDSGVFILDNIKDGISNFFYKTGNVLSEIKGYITWPFTYVAGKIIIGKEDEETTEEAKVMPLYDQTDYGNVPYSKGTIATSGCGITCLAMIASYYTGQEWTPDKCAELVNQSGTLPKDNFDKILIAANQLGLNYQVQTTNELMPALQEGKTAIVLVKDSSHFVVLKGLTEDGKVLVNDPYGPYQTAKDQEGQELGINNNGCIYKNDIKLTAGKIIVFDGSINNNNNTPVEV